MSLDPYSLCPCESGKKLKFCCSDIANEMVKALQLHEGGQSKAALKILEKLAAEHPARAWVATSLAGVYLFLEQPAEARETLKPLLKESPDHPLGRILDATAALDLEGYEGARSAIHRAFTKGVKHHPEMIGSLASGIASALYAEDKFVAARQHLAFSMRFVRDEDRQDVFMRLLDFDNDQSVPYPLRGVHNLRPLDFGNDEEDKTFQKAIKLSALGCWHEAAAVARQLLDSHSDNAELWYDIGLFHAWDGNQEKAAEALHQVAKLTNEYEFAVASETMAQIFDMDRTRVKNRMIHFNVDSVSQTLTKLDEIPRLRRNPPSPEPQSTGQPEISYMVLDRAPVDLPEGEIDLEQLPITLGVLIRFDDRDTGEEENFFHLGIQADHADEVIEMLKPILGEPISTEQFPSFVEQFTASQWADYRGLAPQLDLPESTPADRRLEVYLKQWDKVINKDWPNRPLRTLGGKTPNEASKDEELKVPLTAAIVVLDAYADLSNYPIDTAAMREKFGLPPIEPFEVEDDQELSSCEVMQMLRIPVDSLTDEQLVLLLNRTQLIQHAGFTETVLREILSRGEVVEAERMPQVWHAYIDLARDKYDREAALERIHQARKWADESEQKFEDSLQWEIRLLQFLVVNPETDEFKEFLDQMYKKYLRKLPELEAAIEQFLMERGIKPPWSSRSGIVTAGSSSESSGEMWGPGSSSEQQSSKKLWLPGQE